MPKLPPACKGLLYLLISKYKWFAENNKLAVDGSFYYSDKNLAREMELDRKTIKRHRQRLSEEGLIRTVPGKYEGVSTKYWINQEGVNLSPSKKDKRGTNCPQEGDNLSMREGQNAPPLKETEKKNNKFVPIDKVEKICREAGLHRM